MRALIATTRPFDAVVGDVPDARVGPNQVAIRVEVAGINFADVMATRGDHGHSANAPYVPGLEVVGRVQTLGPGVTGLRRGQRVAAYTVGGGGFAEFAVADAGLVTPVPEGVNPAEAAAVPVTLSTAYLLLEDVARIRAGDRILVHSAAGGMGLALAALARRHAPAILVGTVGSEGKKAHALKHGFDQVIVRGPDMISEVEVATVGRGATVVFGAFGTDGLLDDLQMTAPTGRIIRYGNVFGTPHARLPSLEKLNAANVSIAGFSRRDLTLQDRTRVAAAFEATMTALAHGEVGLPVTEIGGLEELPGFLDGMCCGPTIGKSVVRVSK